MINFLLIAVDDKDRNANKHNQSPVIILVLVRIRIIRICIGFVICVLIQLFQIRDSNMCRVNFRFEFVIRGTMEQ